MAASLAVAPTTVVASSADAVGVAARVPAKWKNCTTVNKRLPHGVGRANARDKTSGTPVTNFKRSTKLYNEAVRANKGLDRDKDGIACEKK